MRRPGCTGDFWPTPLQEALLGAALRPDGAEIWQRNRSGIDVDRLPGELHRLLPSIARRLAEAAVDDPDLGRLRGVRQFTWYRNQRLFAEAAAVVTAFERAGLRPVLLRGAATVVRTSLDAGLRPMNDLDLLVDPSEVVAAERNLRADGWRPERQSAARRAAERASGHTNGEGRRINLHWAPTRNLPADPLWWSTGTRHDLAGSEVATLDPASHLLQVIVDGARAFSGSTLRWVLDATSLLRDDPPEWERLVALAGDLEVGPLLREALSYLHDAFHAGVPDEVMAQLAALPTSARAQAAHRLSGTEVRRLGRLPELVGRYLRVGAGAEGSQGVRGIGPFLQGVLDVDDAAAVPRALASKAATALSGRGPDADLGPESSRA